MANPFVLFENILEDGTLTADSEDSAYPIENVLDWRSSGPYRWHADSATTVNIDVDLGVGVTAEPDTLAIGGHNLGTAGPYAQVYYSDNGSAWTAVYAAGGGAIDDDYPWVKTFTVGAAHRYWRVLLGGTVTVAPQIGVLTLGRRLDWEEGPQPSLDPYNNETISDMNQNEYGAWVGSNIRYIARRFRVQHESPGMSKTGFFQPTSGLTFDTDFVPHVNTGKPFWWVWNYDEEPGDVFLAWVDGPISTPPVGSLTRRGVVMNLMAYREVS